MSRAKIPATIITGFLGAGKTTLIRHLLENTRGRRIALIVNEFGDIGVDGEVLKGCGDALCRADDIIELANGCICCTVADDFIPTMNTLLARPEAFDHIIIETSGLALPQPLVRAFNWPEIAQRVTVDGVITLVDGKAIAEGRYADDEVAVQTMRKADPNLEHENPLSELFNDQVNCADLIVINKSDLLSAAEAQSVHATLVAQARPGTPVIASSFGKLDPQVLLGLAAKAEADVQHRLSTHEMEGEEQHDHDDFISFSVDMEPTASREALLARIAHTLQDGSILRLKGFAAVPGSSARLLVQAVGNRLNSYFDRPWHSDEVRRTQMVVIGVKGMNQQAIATALRG
jgi:cobalamin biosynthesis protein CobW